MQSENDDFTIRTRLLLGDSGLDALLASRIAVFGVGGVGSACVLALTRCGVGSFLLVDPDCVSRSNMNRQSQAFECSVGRKKVDVLRDMVLEINPAANVETNDSFVKKDDVEIILSSTGGGFDFIVDSLDTISTKLALALYAQQSGVPIISCMGAANKIDPNCFEFADLYDTRDCPVCRVLRKEGRRAGLKSLDVIFSTAENVARGDFLAASDEALGSVSYVAPIMGMMAAGRVVLRLSGKLG